MIYLLIELFFFGLLTTNFCYKKLPDLFLSLTAPLMGLISYVFNALILLLLHISLTSTFIMAVIGVEIIVLVIYQISHKEKFPPLKSSLYPGYLLVGLVYGAVLFFFYRFNYTYGTNDSFYMIVMARNIITTGLSKWYFASPAGMGIFVPILQTLGMLFGLDYTWFIQPFMSVVFLCLFFYFCYQCWRGHQVKPLAAIALSALVIGVILSTNIILIFVTYIHTNFDTGLFLFLSLVTLFSSVKENNQNWLFFTAIFLIAFGMMRVENVVFALMMIVIIVVDGSLSHQKLLATFLPYLVLQFLWLVQVLTMKTDSPTDQMSPAMIAIVLAGIIVVGFILLFSEMKLIRRFFSRIFPKLFPLVLIVALAIVSILKPELMWQDLVANLTNMFLTGAWGVMWWFIVIVSIILLFAAPQVVQEHIYLYLISSFFVMIMLLGFFRAPYHVDWYDSANRMYVHILPVALLYLVDKVGIWSERGAHLKNQARADPG